MYHGTNGEYCWVVPIHDGLGMKSLGTCAMILELFLSILPLATALGGATVWIMYTFPMK